MTKADWFTLGIIVAISALVGFAIITAITSSPEDNAIEAMGEFIYQVKHS